MADKITGLANPEQGTSRRDFMAKVAVAAVTAGTTIPRLASAQAAAKPPADPAGVISNDAVMAGKDAALKMHSERPLTASATAEFLVDEVTPTNRVFVRNNLFTTEFSEANHVVEIKGLVDKPLKLTVADIKRMFKNTSTVAMIECAGAGRTAFNPVPRGTPWPATGGMSCPKWNGVRLGDVLKAAGIRSDGAHVSFTGADFGALPTIPKVARSVPLWKALEEHSMIVYGMNDGPLPVVHGAPIRVMIPGWAGSASVKWVAGIEVLNAPLKGPYMDSSYRMPRHPVAPGSKMPEDAVSTEGWPIKSMITNPAPNASFKIGKPVLVAGHAWVAEADIERVELSFDEGRSWQNAQLNAKAAKYAWQTFSYAYTPRGPGYMTVLARATDSKGNTQPIVTPWNPLGYYWNGIHRVGFSVES
ncbi:MAG: sulfite oxidase [Betaproteobacteria bacterium]